MLADADSDSDFLCALQGTACFREYAERALFMDKRFGRDGSVFYPTDTYGRDNVVAAIFANRPQ